MNQQQEKTIEDVNGIDDKMNRVYKLTKSCVFCSVRPKFGIGYGIGQKYCPIWVSVSDLNQNSDFSRTLAEGKQPK